MRSGPRGFVTAGMTAGIASSHGLRRILPYRKKPSARLPARQPQDAGSATAISAWLQNRRLSGALKPRFLMQGPHKIPTVRERHKRPSLYDFGETFELIRELNGGRSRT
jgi:hypothetical protein